MTRPTIHQLSLGFLLLLCPLWVAADTTYLPTSAGIIEVTSLADGLNHPWGMTFLPDGQLLLTERSGNLRLLSTDNKLSMPLSGTPTVFHKGQGGLLDVALDPDFASNQLVYLSFAEPAGERATTALGRGRLHGQAIENFEVLFRQLPQVNGPHHFGGRIVFATDKTLFLTLGERFQFAPAQDLNSHLGKLVHLTRDGSAAADNPFLKVKARPEVWTSGHRNVQAAAFDPRTGKLWIGEMGPQGGDELNLIERGKNYGWPLVSWGKHYDGRDIPDPTSRPEFVDATKYWTPVISPAGMLFYSGKLFPAWQGSMFVGGLTAQVLVRIQIFGERAEERERILLRRRIRDVEQAPDGSIYLLTDEDEGSVLRLRPVL